MSAPTGFVIVVGLGVVLIAALQVLVLAWLIDTARSVRAMAQVITAKPQSIVAAEPHVAAPAVDKPAETGAELAA